jgi:hypothetical protein
MTVSISTSVKPDRYTALCVAHVSLRSFICRTPLPFIHLRDRLPAGREAVTDKMPIPLPLHLDRIVAVACQAKAN